MISVCIPVYNCSIKELLEDLQLCFSKVSVDYEIIVIDDASNMQYKNQNLFIKEDFLSNVKYIELDSNIGRAAIRNLFLEYVHYRFMLFLDCDSKIVNSDFIKNYWQTFCDGAKIICGGRVYADKPEKRKHYLRWKYGVERESFNSEKRSQKPNHSFMTNNFVVDKEILAQIRFNEKLQKYGHEDTLFGYELFCKGFEISHIENPTLHNFNESTSEFLNKTKEGVKNLLYIDKFIVQDDEFQKYSKLLHLNKKIKQYKLNLLLALLSFPVLPIIKLLFLSTIVQMSLFDLYKLLYLSRVSLFSKLR